MREIIICILKIPNTNSEIFLILWFLLPTITIITLLTIDLFQRGIKEFKRKYINDFPFASCLIMILFGPISCSILIKTYKNTKKKEREEVAKMFPWWQLKEHGGWK